MQRLRGVLHGRGASAITARVPVVLASHCAGFLRSRPARRLPRQRAGPTSSTSPRLTGAARARRGFGRAEPHSMRWRVRFIDRFRWRQAIGDRGEVHDISEIQGSTAAPMGRRQPAPCAWPRSSSSSNPGHHACFFRFDQCPTGPCRSEGAGPHGPVRLASACLSRPRRTAGRALARNQRTGSPTRGLAFLRPRSAGTGRRAAGSTWRLSANARRQAGFRWPCRPRNEVRWER